MHLRVRPLGALRQFSARPQQRLLLPNRQNLRYRRFTSRTSFNDITKQTPEDVDPITLHRLEAERRAYYKRRSYYAGAGFVLGMIAIWVTATSVELPPKPAKMDSNKRADDPMVVLGRERKVVVQKLGEEPEEVPDVVETGTSTVPTFPRYLEFYDEESGITLSDNSGTDVTVEYQLMGLGIRTVSFLGVQVYVVGMYVATDDIAALQESLIRKINPVATTLISTERDSLKAALSDPTQSDEIWDDIIKKGGCRMLLRVVPTRNTDFHHLRDGWVRAITARAQKNREEFGDESFGASLNAFKALFNRGSVPQKKELILSKNSKGSLAIWYDDGKHGAQRLGEVKDERISRAIWLNYLGGKTVASEGARQSIIDGVLEYVERPVGTVATQVGQVHV
ncbi:putative altered inheritance of mitochondria protein 18, mitochondrial [Xylogone sp. PMI_703]|nr:putative altered inheritance of mitochondria protein 18, mitochondrial [Xylogone sp. PMI_703]